MSRYTLRTAIKAWSPDRSLRAVSRLWRAADLYEVALKSKHLASQQAAVAKLDVQTLLAELVRELKTTQVRLDAADKLPPEQMQAVYRSVVFSRFPPEKDEDRLHAVAGITDEDKLADAVILCRGPVRDAAFARLTKPASFVKLATILSQSLHLEKTDSDKRRIYQMAMMRLHEQKDLAEVAAYAAPDVACSLIETISDPNLLAMIANTTPRPAVVIAAARKLQPDLSAVKARLKELASNIDIGIEMNTEITHLLHSTASAHRDGRTTEPTPQREGDANQPQNTGGRCE